MALQESENFSKNGQVVFEDVVRSYQNKIYRIALSVVRNESDAADILQNTLIKIFQKGSTFKNRSRFSTWVYRVAYNESLMFLRKKRRLFNSARAFQAYLKKTGGGFKVNWSKVPDQQLLDKELRERIDATLNDISIQYRMPLLLHRIEGFSLQETSRILHISVSTVKTRLHRAYLMVRERMQKYFKDLPEPVRVQEQQCGVWTGFLSDYAHNTLSLARQKAFLGHIKDCPACNHFLDLYKRAICITGALDCRDVPAELKERLTTFFYPLK